MKPLIQIALACALLATGCSKAKDEARDNAPTQLPDKPRQGLDISITSVDATSYQLGEEALVAAMLEGLAGDVRVAASSGGYRIVALRTGSVLARAGLLSGDVVSKVGGVELRGADSLFSAYQSARHGSFEVELVRGRDSVRLRYLVRGSVGDYGLGSMPRPPLAPPPLPVVGPTALPGFTIKSASPDAIEVDVERAELDKLLADTSTLARGARIVPSSKNGFPNGFKLYAIRPGSVFGSAGFMNGDTINRVNGEDMTNIDIALATFGKLKTTKKVRIEITRRGTPMTLVYDIK